VSVESSDLYRRVRQHRIEESPAAPPQLGAAKRQGRSREGEKGPAVGQDDPLLRKLSDGSVEAPPALSFLVIRREEEPPAAPVVLDLDEDRAASLPHRTGSGWGTGRGRTTAPGRSPVES